MSKDLEYEHATIENSYGECDGKPWINYIENFYVDKPNRRAAAIMSADWIPPEGRNHILAHVNKRLAGKQSQFRRVRNIAFSQFVQDPVIIRVSSKRFTYQRISNGQIVKRSRKNGRYARFSKSEKRTIAKANRAR